MARGEGKGSTKLITLAVEILEQGQPMTVRQLFYRLVSVGAIDNSKGDYQKVSRLMKKARVDDRCPWDWIVDRSRPEYTANVFDNPQEYAEVVKRAYRRDYWQDQPRHVEVWSEKDTISGVIEPIAKELGVTLRVGRGFQSCTRKREIADRFASLTGKQIHVLYLGDHDPSGRDIDRELYKTVRLYGAPDFTMVRVAINEDDIVKFDLPPLKVKDTDSRSSRFRELYGNDCVELDALPPAELRRRVETAIRGLIEANQWNRAVMVERAELASIVETVGAWRLYDGAGL